MWALAAVVPGVVSLVVVPFVIYVLCRPGAARTPDAPAAARAALAGLGGIKSPERLMGLISIVLLIAWILGPRVGLDTTSAALIAIAALLLTGVLTWDDICREREAWNTFIWFAALVMMATFLGQFGLFERFTGQVGSVFSAPGRAPGSCAPGPPGTP